MKQASIFASFYKETSSLGCLSNVIVHYKNFDMQLFP